MSDRAATNWIEAEAFLTEAETKLARTMDSVSSQANPDLWEALRTLRVGAAGLVREVQAQRIMALPAPTWHRRA